MRRQVFSGYPCPASAWQALMPSATAQSFVTFAEVLRAVGRPDFKLLSLYVAEKILEFKPDSIICHDYAVPYTLLALLKLRKRGISLNSSLTIFNGAFRGFDVFKTPLPLRSQCLTWKRLNTEAKAAGGEVDPMLKDLQPIVRALYRRIIICSILEKLSSLFVPRKPLGLTLGVRAQIIASDNDPYIPFECLEILRDDFGIQNFHVIKYGHFPYSGNIDLVQKFIINFESL